MTKEEQNAAILKILGYVECDKWRIFTHFPVQHIKDGADCKHANCYPKGFAPNFVDNLGWMREAENFLQPSQLSTYYNFLEEGMTDNPGDSRRVYLASSAVRAEAFLKTLGAWVYSTAPEPELGYPL